MTMQILYNHLKYLISDRILIFLIVLFFPGIVMVSLPQVPVERSNDKVIISGTIYYIHIVKKGETSYSIARAYGVTLDELYRNNPEAKKVLKEGQVLKIPVVETPAEIREKKPGEPQRDESRFFYHKIRPGDTVYSLARYYGVSAEEITASNPGLDINKLPVDTEIIIPRRNISVTTEKFEISGNDYIEHLVVKGESMASIAEKYNITVRELRRENRGIIFPKVDNILRIPVTRVAEKEQPDKELETDTLNVAGVIQTEADIKMPSEITPVRNLRGTINVAVLLPFYTAENSARYEIDSSVVVKGKPLYRFSKYPEEWLYPPSIQFIEMYQGILLAADTLRSLGLRINLHTFDTRSEPMAVEKLISSGTLKEMDLIIGPVYSSEMQYVAKFAGENEIPVVSPVPLKNNYILKDNPFLFMAIPSVEIAQNYIVKNIGQLKQCNFIFIHNDETRSDPTVTGFRDRLLNEIRANADNNNISFRELFFISRSALPADSINRLKQSLSPQMENVVIIASEDDPVLSETIIDLHTLSRKYKITLLGYPVVRELFNLDPKLYFDLGIELYSHYWIDYKQPDVIAFLRKYREKYLTEPNQSSMAWQGYDIMYYFVSGITLHGKKFIKNPLIHNPDLIQTRFYFKRKSENDGFENNYLFLLKYLNSMDIIILNQNNQKQ